MIRSFLLSTALVLGVVVAACNNDPAPATCSDVPAGGCPEDNGADVCTDPTCDTVYECDNGTWDFVQKCPPHPMEAGTDASDAAAASEAASGPPLDATIDAPAGAYGGPGCTDLETPDCSLGTAIACEDVPDCCGCQDLWICENGGWVLWGECGADGGITANPKP